jgi:hypothetical protein
MAATIKQRIELDGGKELKRELEEFGAAGRKAFRDLQSAAAAAKGLSPGFFNDRTGQGRPRFQDHHGRRRQGDGRPCGCK